MLEGISGAHVVQLHYPEQDQLRFSCWGFEYI